MSSSPPIAPLRRLVSRLERAGVTCALGGSGLLFALGFDVHVGDWDLTTDDPLERVRQAIGRAPYQVVGPGGIHADHKIQLRDGEIEIIVGFSMHAPHGTVRLPTLVTGQWNGIPIGSPETWAVAYRLLERHEKSDALFDYLASHGADPEARRRLLAEPLPRDLSVRLAALKRRRPSAI